MVGQVYLHLFLDGRDTPPNSAEQFMLDLTEKLKAFPAVKIATMSGRYYAMDRDKRWDRVEKAYVCLTQGVGKKASSALEAIRESYHEKVTDEFVLPTTISGVVPEGLIHDGDGVIFFNFRADRARELTRALTDPDFQEFPRNRRIELSMRCSHIPSLTSPARFEKFWARWRAKRASNNCASPRRKSTPTLPISSTEARKKTFPVKNGFSSLRRKTSRLTI
jgi:bisphosphoglycerate-independent phosphoglycerate mutase